MERDYNDPNDNKRELFIETYLDENMVHDFLEQYMKMDDPTVVYPFIESHFEGFTNMTYDRTNLTDRKALVAYANECYKADKGMLDLYFKAQTMEEEDAQEMLENSDLTPKQKMLTMGFSIEGLDLLEEWTDDGIEFDLYANSPWEAVREFKSKKACLEHFSLADDYDLSENGLWEELGNGHVLFFY